MMTNSSETNPLIEQQLQALADICCNEIQSDDQAPDKGEQEDRIQPLIEALVRNGFARKSQEPLSVRIDAWVQKQCPEKALSRQGRLQALIGRMQDDLMAAIRMDSSTPPESNRTRDDEVTTGA